MRGKSHRKEVAKKLQEQIAATTDPKLIIELSNQLSKFLPRPRQARRPRKSADVPVESNSGESALVAKWEKRLSHLPIEKRIQFSVILEVEERLKKQGLYKWPRTDESRAVQQKECADVMGMLTEQERLVLAVLQAVEAEAKKVA
jgi:hypothetical protein